MKIFLLFLAMATLFQAPVLQAGDHRDGKSWDFWRSVRQAREEMNQNNPEKALELLTDLPPPPLEIINKQQGYYRRLYHEALETGLAASTQLSKPRETWSRQLWAFFPDFEQPITSTVPAGVRPEDKTARLHILFEKSLFETIPEMISPGEIASVSSVRDKCRAFFELGWALKKLRKNKEALEALGRVERSSCDAKIRTRSLYWKGILETALNQNDAVEKTFNLLIKHSTDGQYKDDAYYRLYKIHQSQNDDEKANRALRHLTNLPEGDMKEKYLWGEAFAAYQNSDYKKAIGFLNQVIATRSIGTEAQPQAFYWKARLSEILSKKKLGGSSTGMYRALVKTYPFSFYTILAEARLGKKASLPSIAKLTASSSSNPLFQVVDELNREKNHEAAADALDYLTHLHPEMIKQSPEGVAQRWMASGDFNRALEIATEYFDTSAFDINLKKDNPMTRALYPVAYLREVKQASQKYRLPMGLVEGIMREESLFLREVRSHAGAIGVMQLMPKTARLVARGLGLSHSIGDLKTPSHNIQLGSSYLRQMMNRFGNKTALAVMAYNAGPGNVSKWIRLQGHMPLDEFIESIPLSETRGYVKRVIRSAHIYEHLFGNPKKTRLIPSLEPSGG